MLDRSSSLAIALTLAMSSALPARAEELRHPLHLSPAPFGPLWGGTVVMPRFDSALGELRSVRILLRVEALGTVRLENLGSAATRVRSQCSAQAEVALAGTALAPTLDLRTRPVFDDLAAFDGALDYKGTSGRAHAGLSVNGSSEARVDPPDPRFAEFTGPGTVTLALSASADPLDVARRSLAHELEFAGSAAFELVYEYEAWGVTARDDAASTCGGESVAIASLANDTIVGGSLDCAGVVLVSQPAHGTVEWQGCAPTDGCSECRFVYAPADGFSGVDSFVYRVAQSGTPLTGDEARVVVTVASGVTTTPDSAVVAPCSAPDVLIQVATNDAWAGELLEITSPPVHGTAAIEQPDGVTASAPCLRYVPSAGFLGRDTLEYRLVGADGCSSFSTAVTVDVLGAPAAVPDGFALCAASGPLHSLHVLANDGDGGAPFPARPVTLLTQPSPAAGTVTAEADGSITFECFPGFRGETTFEYALVGASGCVSSAQAVVHVADTAIARDDAITTLNGAPVTLDVLANDTAADGGSVAGATVWIARAPANGTAHLQDCGDGSGACRIVYTANAGYVGPDSLAYVVESAPGCIAEAEVDLDVRDPTTQPLLGGLLGHGSLLVFPEYDSRPGSVNLITVTNTHQTSGVRIEYVFIQATGSVPDCLEFNRAVQLTANDTLTVLASVFAVQPARGYLYVFAKSLITAQPIAFDYLIGNEFFANGVEAFTYSTNPFLFRSPQPEGASTNIDGDFVRDLNGIEYAQAPDTIVVPRFFGQSTFFQGELVVIPLSGGTRFSTTIDFLIFNDNEQVFSGQRVFPCWSKRPLLQISAAFSEAFLESTNHAATEVLGASNIESGWFSLDGLVANSEVASITDPAVLALYVEGLSETQVADLPFVQGTQDNGDLLPTGILPDSN